MIQIVEVTTKKQLKTFASLPIKLYKDCPYYVPSMRDDEMSIMNPKKNFNLGHCDCKCFLAYKDGKAVGRIAGIINKKANEIYNHKYIRFARLAAIDDIEVFRALLNAVENYGKSQGLNKIHGPWGFNDTDRDGMLTYGFDKRSTYSTEYSYPYYMEKMVELGFRDESKWIERDFVIPTEPYEKIERIAEKLKKRYKLIDVTETMTINQIVKKYGDDFFKAYNQAYSVLDEYVPIEGDAQKSVLNQFATVINTRYASILVNEDDQVVGFGLTIPSLSEALIKSKGKLLPFGFIGVLKSIKKPKELEMVLIGVRDEYKNSGINSICMSKIMNNVIKDGIKKIESNPMLETNLSIQANWNFAENTVIKMRQTYYKEIV